MRQSSILLSSILWSAPCNNHLSRRARARDCGWQPRRRDAERQHANADGRRHGAKRLLCDGRVRRLGHPPPKNHPHLPHSAAAALPLPPPPPPPPPTREPRPPARLQAGSGKGTQCALLSRHFGMTHLSAGDLLREEVASGSDTGQSIERIITAGKIVPSDVTVGLLQAAMAGAPGPFLIDGFPRSLSNLHAFDEAVGRCAFMLFLELGEAEMESRLIKRGATSGRSDDNAETIRKRFRTFNADSMPVIEELQKLDAVRFVSADGSVEEVFQRVLAAFAGEPLSVV